MLATVSSFFKTFLTPLTPFLLLLTFSSSCFMSSDTTTCIAMETWAWDVWDQTLLILKSNVTSASLTFNCLATCNVLRFTNGRLGSSINILCYILLVATFHEYKLWPFDKTKWLYLCWVKIQVDLGLCRSNEEAVTLYLIQQQSHMTIIITVANSSAVPPCMT